MSVKYIVFQSIDHLVFSIKVNTSTAKADIAVAAKLNMWKLQFIDSNKQLKLHRLSSPNPLQV